MKYMKNERTVTLCEKFPFIMMNYFCDVLVEPIRWLYVESAKILPIICVCTAIYFTVKNLQNLQDARLISDDKREEIKLNTAYITLKK